MSRNRKQKVAFVPATPDGLEARLVMTASPVRALAAPMLVDRPVATPVLTERTLERVARDVDRAFSRLQRSGDLVRLQSDLVSASSKMPYGRQFLLPVWLDDISIIDGYASAGEAYHLVRQDLRFYVEEGVDSGLFRYNGPLPGQHGGGQQAIPTVTSRALQRVQRDIDSAFSRAARSGDMFRLNRDLTAAAYKVPFGGQYLLPVWLDTVSAVDSRASLGEAYHIVRDDYRFYVQEGVEAGLFRIV